MSFFFFMDLMTSLLPKIGEIIRSSQIRGNVRIRITFTISQTLILISTTQLSSQSKRYGPSWSRTIELNYEHLYVLLFLWQGSLCLGKQGKLLKKTKKMENKGKYCAAALCNIALNNVLKGYNYFFFTFFLIVDNIL